MDNTVTDLDRHRALAHPLRHRVLMALRSEQGTISGLARRLQVHKGSIAHHLAVLVEAGMVRPAARRQVRGGTEQYYEIAVGAIRTSDPDATTAMLTAVAAQVTTADRAAGDDVLLHLRHVRLTEEQALRVRAALEGIVDELPISPGGRTHGVLVSLYPMSP
ncbi:winged helix-turn-helix domain-containing protein [Nakamurella sp. A5-74]|uniref:Winged helix-turn-helix domain-containing protein n=1 Tax=Nakamurella sp. A5-74 TaxID=3158264 RepID=A0AAU8DQA5_9ACTN